MSESTEVDESEEVAAPDPQPEPPTRFGVPLSDSLGVSTIHPSPEEWLGVAEAARAEGFDHLTDLTAVDYLTYGAPRGLPDGINAERFEVVAHLSNVSSRERLRLRAQVPADEPTLPTLFDVWPGAEALEREVYDMFGIVFADHPDMCRILMPDDWVGHPLRKDYAVGQIPVQFKDEGMKR